MYVECRGVSKSGHTQMKHTDLILKIAALFVIYSLGHHAITAWQSVTHVSIQSLSVSVQKPQEVAPVLKALLPPLEVRR